ncbi:MAG: tRNA 2-thiouridine(34) synthase MnmA, partial [Candidatus Mcinerneyibacterium aminivorans]
MHLYKILYFAIIKFIIRFRRNHMNRKSVMVGMSGGVDSSVAAAILKEKGYRVIGYTLKFGKENNKCCLIDDAKQVADRLGIEYLTIDISSEFEKEIVKYFINQYLKGKTPSPCPKCNLFKFGLGIEYAQNNNIDYVSTGHYAKIKNHRLITASSRKDQAYFLSRLPKRYFEKILLPLGEMKKSEVRKYANKINLHIADKSDSQDICFVEDDYREFLKKRGIKEKEGKVINK